MTILPGFMADRPGTPVMEARGLGLRFGSTTALHDVSLAVMPGESHALAGRNGAGKSTYVAQLTGQHQPGTGSIRFNGQPAPAVTDRMVAELDLVRRDDRDRLRSFGDGGISLGRGGAALGDETVDRAGGLFFLGDAHATQGDGEIVGLKGVDLAADRILDRRFLSGGGQGQDSGNQRGVKTIAHRQVLPRQTSPCPAS